MTLSDDEDEDIPVGGSDGGGEGVLMVPPPSYASAPGVGGGGGVEGSASSLSGGGSGGGGGGTAATAGGGCKGPGAGGVVPYREPTYYGSKTRGARAAAGLSESGAISWRGRACPPWLQSELDAGTVSGTGEPQSSSIRFGLCVGNVWCAGHGSVSPGRPSVIGSAVSVGFYTS